MIIKEKKIKFKKVESHNKVSAKIKKDANDRQTYYIFVKCRIKLVCRKLNMGKMYMYVQSSSIGHTELLN